MKEVTLFKTGLTRNLYDDLLNSLDLKRTEFKSSPFVYVEPTSGDVRLLTNLLSSAGCDDDMLAVSMEDAGMLEVLSFG
jgi:hypothetical protein